MSDKLAKLKVATYGRVAMLEKLRRNGRLKD
jgi:hypothetical protein